MNEPILDEIEEKEVDTKVQVKGYFENESIKAMDDNVFEAVVNTGKPDRQGEKINIDGVDLRSYKKNPTVLYGHDYNALPIGKALSVRKTENGIVAKFRMAIEENPFAADIAKMIQGGYLNAVSIGVIVKEWSKDFTEIVTSEMVEFSVVPVPADQGALIQRALGKSEDEFKKDYHQSLVKTLADKGSKDEISQHLHNLKALVALLEESHKESQNEAAPEKVKVIRKVTLTKAAGQLVKESQSTLHVLRVTLK